MASRHSDPRGRRVVGGAERVLYLEGEGEIRVTEIPGRVFLVRK